MYDTAIPNGACAILAKPINLWSKVQWRRSTTMNMYV